MNGGRRFNFTAFLGKPLTEKSISGFRFRGTSKVSLMSGSELEQFKNVSEKMLKDRIIVHSVMLKHQNEIMRKIITLDKDIQNILPSDELFKKWAEMDLLMRYNSYLQYRSLSMVELIDTITEVNKVSDDIVKDDIVKD